MAFEIGKTYQTTDGKNSYKIVAVAQDGRLVVELLNKPGDYGDYYANLYYRNADGSSKYPSLSLVDPDAVSEEEIELIAKIWDSIGCFTRAGKIRRERVVNGDDRSMLGVIREIKEGK